MVQPPWLDRLRRELRKRALPSTYSARLIEELTDHITDVQKENRSMDALTSADEKMGSPELLASVAERELIRLTFAGRHPIVAFVIGPIPAIILTLSGMITLLQICGWLIPAFTGGSATPDGTHTPTANEWTLIYGFLFFWRTVPFVLTAWFFIRLGRRARRPVWGLAACGIVASVATLFCTSMRPATDQHPQLWLVGVGFHLDQWLQAALPLALGLWAWWRMTYPTKSLPWRRDVEPSSAPTHA